MLIVLCRRSLMYILLLCAGSNTVSVAEDVVMRILVMVRNFLPAHEQVAKGEVRTRRYMSDITMLLLLQLIRFCWREQLRVGGSVV